MASRSMRSISAGEYLTLRESEIREACSLPACRILQRNMADTFQRARSSLVVKYSVGILGVDGIVFIGATALRWERIRPHPASSHYAADSECPPLI